MNRAVIRTKRRAPGHVIKKPADGTVDCHRPDARTFARAEAPVVFSESLVSTWIADGEFLVDTGRRPAVLKIVAPHFAHETVANPAEIHPRMRELMDEERACIERRVHKW